MRDTSTNEVSFNSVKAIFEHALGLEADARSAYLVSACASDRIRLRVEQMLGAHEAGDAWLGLLTGNALDDAIESPREDAAVPDRIGRYKIVRKIGVGGMGVVYEGLQHSPRRSVAIKVMSDQVPPESAARRFPREIEILGRLRHPAIAQIFDADIDGGGSEGSAYFAMAKTTGTSPPSRASA